MPDQVRRVRIAIDTSQAVSGLLQTGAAPRCGYVFAHGAGAGMEHPFMATAAAQLAERGIASLRYQFPSMENGSGRPDSPAVAHAAVRAAVDEAGRLLPGLPLIAGGKSFGGRMTSQAQADAALPGVIGLAFVGFPLHPAGKPATARADHLSRVQLPMLFLQGTNDRLADASLLRQVIDGLGRRATLRAIEAADHSFHVPARSGRTDQQVQSELWDGFAAWVESLIR